MLIRRTAIGLVLALLVALPAIAQDFQKGMVAYKRGDYATALREFRPLAMKGDAVAQNNLGLIYSKGQGVPQDYAEAAKLFRKAVEQGYAKAQNNLGAMYNWGLSAPQDYALADMWFSLAAINGYKNAQKCRDYLVPLMSTAQIAEAEKLMREWWATQNRNNQAYVRLWRNADLGLTERGDGGWN
jgi:TPR repeat protein